MMYRVLPMAAAAAALALSGPVLAQQSNGKQTREQARKNSQGPANANPRGIERSNENSVLKGNVQPGMMVHDKKGKMIGSVKEVRKSPTGVIVAIVVVLVVQIDGTKQITLTPGSFTIVNNIIVAINLTAPSGS
nr:hypothetical protein [uncultured Sphingosinicella sp.]